MAFNSVQYLAFLLLAVAVYWKLRPRKRVFLLLAGSYAFYAAWDWRFLGLILVSTATDYTVGRYLGGATDPSKRRRALILSLGVNLGLLAVFKYFSFFYESATALIEAMGFQANPASLRILLPVGISFYTFQTLSYTIDVYRGRTEPIEDPVVFATFVAFFPQLVAGPIERADHLIPQLEGGSPRRTGDLLDGVGLIVLGLFKKVAIADVAAHATNAVFNGPRGLGAATLAMGTLAFAIQIYGDFSGYTDIARGSARLFGIRLHRNFAQPYLSRSITEFWRRWHMTLSSWLRDYLYIPLGGNRKGRRRTYINLMITMLLGGLWHGAAWTFVVWGGLHGLALAFERRFLTVPAAEKPVERFDWVRVLITFGLVNLAWIFFRAATFSDAWVVLTGILTWTGGDQLADVSLVPVLGVVVLLIDLAGRGSVSTKRFAAWEPARQGLLLGVLILGILLASGGQPSAFIYFQF